MMTTHNEETIDGRSRVESEDSAFVRSFDVLVALVVKYKFYKNKVNLARATVC
jgi:hypothetical protein